MGDVCAMGFFGCDVGVLVCKEFGDGMECVLSLDCDDGDVCMDDVCDFDLGCIIIDKSCNDGDFCILDGCDLDMGCIQIFIDCSDGMVCNGLEICGAVGCALGVVLDCDDGNVCMDDICDDVVGC